MGSIHCRLSKHALKNLLWYYGFYLLIDSMKYWLIPVFLLTVKVAFCSADIKSASPPVIGTLKINTQALCNTAKETLSYLKYGPTYDPQVIHEGHIFKVPMPKIKETLTFICAHQSQMSNPEFVSKHFNFYRWYPDRTQINTVHVSKSLIKRIPLDKILMTKYYVHLAHAKTRKTPQFSYPIYGVPPDEAHLSIEEAEKSPHLIRFQYGKQAILKGALNQKDVPVLAYVKRDDLEAALLQGTLVAVFPNGKEKIFNVHRDNHVPYDKNRAPYAQERYWYFKEVHGIKGYGKDAYHKITVQPLTTFAGDLTHFGLGKLLMVQYHNAQNITESRMGILADTGGAFANNQYQVDYLSGSYANVQAFAQANKHLPDYVQAYFLVVK